MNISEERLNELLAAEKKLNALEAAGVDNWDGYDFAFEDEESYDDIYGDDLNAGLDTK